MLKKKYRLPIQTAIGKRGQLLKTPYFLVKVFYSTFSYSRFGVVISKKVVAKSTKRNNLRRLIFSVIRDFDGGKNLLIPNRDFLIIVSPAIWKLNKEEIKMHLREIFDKLR